ncbi:MAG: Sec-independent protein translocase TatB, partial [Caulobacter sp. 39-67-4]
KPRAAKAPMMVEPAPAKAPARKRAAKTEIAVEAPKAARAPRKKAVKAGGSTASDIIS